MEKSHCWIFLSHSSVDIEKVRMIRNEFEACGHNPLAFYLKCLNDSTQKNAEELWNLIYREIDSRDWFVFCESQASRNSPNVSRERAYIIENGKKFVWSLDLTLPDDKIKARIHQISSDIRVYMSGTYSDLITFGKTIKQELIKADYDVWSLDEWDRDYLNNPFIGKEAIKRAISRYGKFSFCLLLITKEALQDKVWMSELDYLLTLDTRRIGLVFDDVIIPEKLKSLELFRIPHIPDKEDAGLIRELLDAILQIEIIGPIKFDAHVFDKLNEIDERLNYTHRYHPANPVLVKNLGATEDYGEIWQFPCCGKIVRTGDREPSRYRSDGCRVDDDNSHE